VTGEGVGAIVGVGVGAAVAAPVGVTTGAGVVTDDDAAGETPIAVSAYDP